MNNPIFLLLFIISSIYGKVLIPQGNILREELLINGNSREYFLLDNNIYAVNGPSTITVFARMACPKKQKNTNTFTINTFIKGLVNSSKTFNKKIDFGVSSSFHPMHNYTKSGKIDINVPEGEFEFFIENNSFFVKPILIRVIQKK